METKYNHKLTEENKNKKWIDKKYFSTHDNAKKPFTIILPPPNVTGKLHLGHAWNGFIQDTIIRYKKIAGFDVMWIPGMDHAGIATQAKVEEKLKSEGKNKIELGREKFLDEVWKWKEEYASNIREQWSTLGLALDYPSERFTLDDGLSAAVSKVFIDLHKRNIIYKGTRPVNFDPKLGTVLSNIEVINKDTEQTMYYIDYSLKSGKKVSIATVRPETLFSDVALAINPNDENNKTLIGKTVVHPLTNKELPIIGDSTIEIGKGTGIMKVSAHAEMDFGIIKNNNLEVIECIDNKGIMNEQAMEFKGIDRFLARTKIIEKLESENKISKKEKTVSAVGYSERSGEPIEILVQPQWFIKMEKMASLILEDMNKDGVNFYPDRFKNTLTQWMENAHDWCISRQLWWGHRIPAWYKDEETKVQVESPGEGWTQDEDVLDTWFSSGIAPFSFLGWPLNEEKLKRYYPTDLLVTAYDIIFFWVARMYFQSLDIMKEKPFADVLIHGLIRAEDGKKMSKSLGNGIDPIKTIEKYGSDSLRWFLLTNSTPGQDIRYSSEKIEAAWNLNNKLWNVSRYIIDIMDDKNSEITEADKWINNKLFNLNSFIEEKIQTYDFTIIGKEITKYIVEDFSSWYIEISKTNPNKSFAIDMLKKTLVMLHPFLPFITDHIFTILGEELLEQNDLKTIKIDSENSISRAIDIIKLIREFRHSKNITVKEELGFHIDTELTKIEKNTIEKLGIVTFEENKDALIPYNDHKIFIKLTEEAKAKETNRIKDRIKFLESEYDRSSKMLNNESFVKNAPDKLIDEEKEKLAKFKTELSTLKKET